MQNISSFVYLSPRGGGEALECNMTRRCPFFKNFHNLFGKKLSFEIKLPENNRENNILLLLNKSS